MDMHAERHKRVRFTATDAEPADTVLVRWYISLELYAEDASTLAADGWSVRNTTEYSPRSGCLRLFLLGPLLTLLFPPEHLLVVTYIREA